MSSALPLILAVDDDTEALARIESELVRRYTADYALAVLESPAEAERMLAELAESGRPVALVLADQWMPGRTGTELLRRAHELHPQARRALLVEWGAWSERETADAMLGAMALGAIDYYLLKPTFRPDEYFHRTISEFLDEWARSVPSTPHELTVVGRPLTAATHRITSLLSGNGVAHRLVEPDSEAGRRILERAGAASGEVPVVAIGASRTLVDPTPEQVADAYGVNTELGEEREFDVVVVGAGPAGLAAAVYAASEGLRTLVVERESVGGQAGSSSLIRNYLGFPRGLGGAELTQRAYQQAWVFGARFVVMRAVSGLREGAPRHEIVLGDGTVVGARSVILATGVAYRRLDLPELEALHGAGVFYGASVSEARALAGADTFVIGGGNSAGQAAMHLSRHARRVTLLVRGASLAASMSSYLCDVIEAAPNVEVSLGTEVVGGGGDGRLRSLVLRDRATGAERQVEAAGLFVMIGARPHTDWLPETIERDRWGFVLTDRDASGSHWRLDRAPYQYETCVPGIFAVGDVRSRSVKRVASAVGEGSVVVQHVHAYLAGLVGDEHERAS